MVESTIQNEALGERIVDIRPIVDSLMHYGVDSLFKKEEVSIIVGDILNNKHLRKEKEIPLIKLSKKLQHFITAIRVAYTVEVRREVIGRFVPTLLAMINEEIKSYGILILFSNEGGVINSRTKIKLIRMRSKKKSDKFKKK